MIAHTGLTRPTWVAPANGRSLLFAGGDSIGSEFLADSPLALWTMQDDSGCPRDRSSNGRHMTSGTGMAQSLGIGAAPRSYDYDYQGHAIEDAAWMDTTTITVEALVVATYIGGSVRMLVCRDTGGGGGRIFQFRFNTSSKLEAIPFVGTSPIVFSGATTLSSGTAYAVAWTHDGDVSRLYVNGVLDATSGSLGALDTGASPIQVATGQGAPLDGRMAYVGVYGTALSGSRLLAHAQVAGLA